MSTSSYFTLMKWLGPTNPTDSSLREQIAQTLQLDELSCPIKSLNIEVPLLELRNVQWLDLLVLGDLENRRYLDTEDIDALRDKLYDESKTAAVVGSREKFDRDIAAIHTVLNLVQPRIDDDRATWILVYEAL